MYIKKNKPKDHNFFMSLALLQAKKAIGNTSENPPVGCVIVKNNHILSVGYTSKNGRPHAERNAIKSSKISLNNSILYSTLEPCVHFGKTPPCINIISKNKIKKVFFSINDPDHRTFKKSYTNFKKRGVLVNSGILSKKINFFYRDYIKFKKKGLPFVTCKIAMSKDFFTVNIKKKWITNQSSRKRVHLLRSEHDCVITSGKTIIKDNPELTCRINGLLNTSPSRIILDKNLKIPIYSKIIKNAKKYKTLVFYNKNNDRKLKLLKKLKVKTFKIELCKNGYLDLVKSLFKAKSLGFSRIFLETGLNLSVKFLKNNLVDELKVFASNHNIRTHGRNNIKQHLNKLLINKKPFYEKVNLFGDVLKSYKIK